VGDTVTLKMTSSDQAVIEGIQERRTLLYRSDQYKSKLLAANLTRLFIVVATEPGFADDLISRSLVAAEGIVTTEAKAKALRPVAEKVITKARKGGLHNHRQILSFLGDQEIAAKLMDEIGPRYADRPGGYTRVLKLGPRSGDNAPMARIELV